MDDLATQKARVGSGQFQWLLWSWMLYPAIGTLVFVGLAFHFASYGQWGISLLPLLWTLAADALAWVLWRHRGRFDPFPSLMILLTVLSFGIAITLLATTLYANDQMKLDMNWPPTPLNHVMCYTVTPACMVMHCLLEKRLLPFG